MQSAFPDATVLDYQALISAMTCDPKDRHVLAGAVAGGSAVLVTFNLKDFPAASTEMHQLAVVSPDAFLLDQHDLHPDKVVRALRRQQTEAERPPLSMSQLLERLARAGVPDFASEMGRQQIG